MKKICFFTGFTQKEEALIKKFSNSKNFKTQLIVSGSHLSKRYRGSYIDNYRTLMSHLF